MLYRSLKVPNMYVDVRLAWEYCVSDVTRARGTRAKWGADKKESESANIGRLRYVQVILKSFLRTLRLLKLDASHQDELYEVVI